MNLRFWTEMPTCLFMDTMSNPKNYINLYHYIRPILQSARKLVTSVQHSEQVKRQRTTLIASRVRIVSVIFAMVTPLWILVDWFAFPLPIWAWLALLRFVSTLIFLFLIYSSKKCITETHSLLILLIMLSVPPGFYLASIPIIEYYTPLDQIGRIYYSLFSLLPLVVVAGLSVFPLTVFETLFLATPIFLTTLFGTFWNREFDIQLFINKGWIIFLLTGVSMVSGMNQLFYMIELIRQASHDGLTGAYTRKTGTEAIELLFRLSTMHNTNLTIAYFDLDDFKKLNDEFGHDAGDRALLDMTRELQSHLRKGDMVIRWGGEEFLILLANTNLDGAKTVIKKIISYGFGKRPNGTALTASIGVAERISDNTNDWPELLELADKRMYQAKQSGKARSVFGDNDILIQEIKQDNEAKND